MASSPNLLDQIFGGTSPQSGYLPIYERVGKESKVDPLLLRAIARVESSENPAAVGKAGEIGLMQLMPVNTRGIDPNDPEQNIRGGAKVLLHFLDQQGNDVGKALQAYNAGNDPRKWNPQYAEKVLGEYRSLKSGTASQPQMQATSQPQKPPADLLDTIFGPTVAAPAVPSPATKGPAPAQPPVLPPMPPSGVSPMADLATGMGAPQGAGAFIAGAERGLADYGNTLLRGAQGAAGPLASVNPLLGASAFALDQISSPEARTGALQQYEQAYGDSGAALGGRVLGNVVAGAGPSGLAAKAVPATGLLTRTAQGAASGAAGAAAMSGGSDVPLAEQVGLGSGIGAAFGLAPGAARSLAGKLLPEAEKLGKEAVEKFGIMLRGSQLTDSPVVRFLDSVLQKTPFSGMQASNEAQRLAFTKAVGKSIGVDADALTPDVVKAGKRAIGDKFERVAASTSIRADATFASEIRNNMDEARMVLTAQEVAPLEKQVSNIVSKIQNGRIDGKQYQALTRTGSPLDRAIESENPNISHYATRIKESLDDAMERSASPAMRDLLREAKYQWKNYITIRPLIAKAEDGQIKPALLLNRVGQVYGNMDVGGGGDLGQLARIGQRFLKEAPTSGTAERMGLIALLTEAGFAVTHPQIALPALATTAGALGIGRGLGGVLKSDAYRNMLLQPDKASALMPTLQNALISQGLQSQGNQ